MLRGLTLVSASVALGGIAWVLLVLQAEPNVKPDRATRRALSLTACGGWTTAVAQTAVMLVALGALADAHGGWPVRMFFDTSFARTAVARVLLGVVLGVTAMRLAHRPAPRGPWVVLAACALALVGASAMMSHAVSRIDNRALLLGLDAAHQLAAGVWVGGLAHLTLYAAGQRRDEERGVGGSRDPRRLLRRFSALALAAVGTLVVAGVGLTALYVGEAAALIGTAYGIMVLTKVVLLAAVLGLAWTNFRTVRRAAASPGLRVFRLVEVELGLGVTVLVAAASLTSLPPAVDVREDRSTPAEVAGRFVPALPRLASPPADELNRTAEPLMAAAGDRKPIERAWSEFNHHSAGFFVFTMGVLAVLERLGLRPARHWPLMFLGLAAFLFVRNDPRAWPLGPAGFWESFTLPDVLQHRLFVLLLVAFGVFEWLVRTGALRVRPWAYVFPLLCAVGGGLLLTHSHAMLNIKEEFLTEVTHAPLGILGAFAGWARWLELRLPQDGRTPGWIWRGAFTAAGLLLLVYREN